MLAKLILFFGLDDPAKVTRWVMRLSIPLVALGNAWLVAHGLPALPDELVKEIVAGLVVMIIAAEAKAIHAQQMNAKVEHAKVMAGAATEAVPDVSAAAKSLAEAAGAPAP